MPEAKSHRGEGNERAMAAIPPSPAMRKSKAEHLKHKVSVCMGWGLANCRHGRQKLRGGGAMSGKWQQASRVLGKVARCLGLVVLAAMFGAAQPRVNRDPPVGGG